MRKVYRLCVLMGCLLTICSAGAQPPEGDSESRLTLGPQVMTYEELAIALSTPERRVLVSPDLKQGAVLVYLKNRSWQEAVRLLEYGLELRFTADTDSNGTTYWLMERDPQVLKRDARLFDQYARVATQTIQARLRLYDELLTRPLSELQQEYRSPTAPSTGPELQAEELTWDTPLPLEILESMRRWARLYWAQSLDGYVMLRWMRSHWNEALTRRLLLERGLIMLQPRALGVEGLTDDELSTFLRDTDANEEYNLVQGVVGWSSRERIVIPFCDLLSPYGAGTGWLLIPILLRVEPPTLEQLFQQMSKEAYAYYTQLSERQVSTLSGYKPAQKPFQVNEANALSELLENFAKELNHEVLMELAPEREAVVSFIWQDEKEGKWRLSHLLNPTAVLSEANGSESSVWKGLEDLYLLFMAGVLTEPTEGDISLRQILIRALDSGVGVWRYEVHEGVLIARNLFAFLDRRYRYPLKELLELERALSHLEDEKTPRKVEKELGILARFARAVCLQPDPSLPVLSDYRLLKRIGGDDFIQTLPAIMVLERQSNKTRLLQRLRNGNEVSLPVSTLGAINLDKAVRLWRLNVFHQGVNQQPFGYRHAWHPDFVAMLRQSAFHFNPDEERNLIFVYLIYHPSGANEEFSDLIGWFPLRCSPSNYSLKMPSGRKPRSRISSRG
jgi:hypothetical protein